MHAQKPNHSDRKGNQLSYNIQRQSRSAGKEGGAWGGRETPPLKKRFLSLPKNELQKMRKEKACSVPHKRYHPAPEKSVIVQNAHTCYNR